MTGKRALFVERFQRRFTRTIQIGILKITNSYTRQQII